MLIDWRSWLVWKSQYLSARQRCNSIYLLGQTTFFIANNVILLNHIDCLPDLNDIANICGWMARKIFNGRQLQTVHGLRETIFITWYNIPANLLQTLVLILPKRIFEVIKMTAVQLTIEMSCWEFSTLFRIFKYGTFDYLIYRLFSQYYIFLKC